MESLDLFPLNVECSIYGMTAFNGNILVTTLDCKIYCITFNKYKPQIREIEFAYIPNGAKIILISALKRITNDYVIGITHYKNTNHYFNVYVSGSGQLNFDLDQLAQGCQTIRLKYVSYHLCPTETIVRSTRLPCWLLSGGDNRIHVFLEDKSSQSFEEKSIEDYFPELDVTFDCPALWIDVITLDNHERAVALGFENGSVRLFHSFLDSNKENYKLFRSSRFEDYSTIVPCVKLFKINSISRKSEFRSKLNNLKVINNEERTNQQINLLVISSTQPCLVFEDVLDRGLESKQELPESQRSDCNTTAAIGDINLDGRNEIFIGNYGKELLTYRYNTLSLKYELDTIQTFNNPIYSISMLDITGDVLEEVSILLSNGVLIVQSPIKNAIEVCERRVDAILSKMNKVLQQ